MKLVKALLLFLAIFVLFPTTTLANEKINVYLFKRKGCTYCENALAFFKSLDSEYKNYFNLVEKEVTDGKENALLLQKTASYFQIELKGVPFIVIGEQYFTGYKSEDNEKIKNAIKEAYENKDGLYKDIIAKIKINKKETSNNTPTIIIMTLGILLGASFLYYVAKEPKKNKKK